MAKAAESIGYLRKVFLETLDILFPKKDILNPESPEQRKADLTFHILVSEGAGEEEIKAALLDFAKTWRYQDYMPADILECYHNLYPRKDKQI